MLPEAIGNIPDLSERGPEKHQGILVIFRTSSVEVRNVTKEANLRSGMLPTRSGMLPARSGMLPKTLVIFRTSLCEVRNLTSSYW